MRIHTVKHAPVLIPSAWELFLTQNWHTTKVYFTGIRDRKELSVRWLVKEFTDISEEELEQVKLWVDDNLGIHFLKEIPQPPNSIA